MAWVGYSSERTKALGKMASAKNVDMLSGSRMVLTR